MKAGKFIIKYNHIWTLLYIVFYMPWFMWLEKTVTTDFHLVSMPIDYKIPFCEYFIIPYFMWFLFVPAIVGYEFFYSKKEYYQCCAYLFSGMTIFLIICTIWHNGLDLRQDISYNNNLCAKLVKMLYKTDTSTNVFPSLHVFNTLGCLVALYRSKGMKDKTWIKVIATIIGILIILSTMFLKQHSVIDVCLGSTLALFGYLFFYPQKTTVRAHKKVVFESISKEKHRKF